jgi:Na+-driven multidrug efflux pump
MIAEIIWYAAIVWTIIGFITFLSELVFNGKFLNLVIWDFPERTQEEAAVLLFIACVGVWPIVWMYNLLAK